MSNRWTFTSSIRWALLRSFLIVAVLPIVVLGIAGVRHFENKHIATIASLLDTHALNVSNEAFEFLQDTNRTLHLVAAMIEEGELHGRDKIDAHLQLAVDKSESFESIYILDAKNKIVNLALASRNVANRDDYLGLDMSSHHLFARADTLTGPTWSETFLSTITMEPSITLGVPYGQGTLLGTVSLRKLTKELMSRLENITGIVEGYQFSLIDHNGVLIADSRPGLTEQRLNMRMHPEVRNALDSNVEIFSKFHEDRSLMESVRLVPETGWAAYVSLPYNVAMEAVRPLRVLLVSVLSFAAGLGMALSYWFSRRLLKPILTLRDVTSEVARGNYAQTLPVVAYNELESLSTSFRDMVVAVEEREHSIREGRARYQGLVNSIDGIVWELDLATFRFTFVSEQAEKILGYKVSQWMEEKDFWQNHIHDEDREWAVNYCIEETKNQRDHDFEYRMVSADGRTVWLKDLVTVITEGDRPVRLSGVMLDISRRKEAERVLTHTMERLQLLIERMPFGCILWDVDSRVEVWNPAAQQVFGFGHDEVIGRHASDFMAPVQDAGNIETMFAELDCEDFVHCIIDNLTKDGQIITCEWYHTRLKDLDGRNAGVISMVEDITQRAAAENALKESEARFRTVFETSPDAVLISRLSDGTILNINDYCSKLSGYSRDDMIGRTTVELGLWVDDEARKQYIATVRKVGSVDNFETRFRTRGGREGVGLVSARLLTLNDEMCLLSVIRDVTASKEVESRIARSEERFRSLASVLGEGLVILGFNGEIVQCNHAAERILKRSAEEIVGLMHHELAEQIFREDGGRFAVQEHPATVTLTTGQPVINQVMGLQHKNAEVLWLQVNTHPLGLDKHGKPTALVMSFADVSGFKQIESELRENEAHLQALSRQFEGVLKAIPDHILILDRGMQVIWHNWNEETIAKGDQARKKVSCCQFPGVVCGPAAELGPPLCENCPVLRSFASRRVDSAQHELSDGRIFALRTFPVLDQHGIVTHVIQIAQDITEVLKQQSQAMRTGQLAALGELAAGVAHEINNPINGVINYAQLILNNALAESRERDLSQRIIKEAERVAKIVRELLYFSREESQEIDRITIATALDEALALLKHQLDKEGIVLEIRLPEDLPMVESRSHQIPRLFLNLLSNARYALNKRYPEPDPCKVLKIAGQVVTRGDRSMLQVVFRDHGCGIPDDLLKKVINPFVTTKPSSEGTGLGLSISHDIMQKHGGTLSIESVLGEYTEVTLELPAIC